MSELTHEQLESLRRRLDDRQRSLLLETRDELQNTEQRQYAEVVDRAPVDEGDQSVSTELADLNMGMMNRHMREIRDIETAKARLQDAGYGTCAECGRDIGFERLLVQPTALRCVDCQEQWEKIHAHDGPPKI
jgi:RNA polymerase-binding transcription factor